MAILKSVQFWVVFKPGHNLAIQWSHKGIIVVDTPAGLSNKLLKEGEKILAFFSGLRNEQLETMVYSKGTSWSVKHVLAHFVSAERGFIELLTDFLAGGSGVPEEFDLDAFNQSQVSSLQDLPVKELLDKFRELRQQTVSTVNQMHPELLDQTAQHPYLGRAPLVNIIKLIYRHNQIHLRDVRRVIEAN
jgi:hypothetical protein